MAEIKSIAIIPARGGSKRIQRKNIRPFLGKPILAYSIEQALESGCFDEVMVSTDDNEIACVAKHYGARVPFFRSNATSDDMASTADVILEVLAAYRIENINPVTACCLYATAPFVTIPLLKNAQNLLTEYDADVVLPIVQYAYPIQRAFVSIEKNHSFSPRMIQMMYPQNMQVRSQDLEQAFHDSGQFYFFKVSSFLEQRVIFMQKTIGIPVSEMNVHDIDTPEDWDIAELKFKLVKEMGK